MEPVTKNLPVIAMRGLNVFPRMNTSFDLERPISVHALERAMENGEEIFLVTQREIGVEQPEEKDLYEIGTVARVTQILRVSDRVLRVMMEGACRARLKRLWQREPFLQAQVELIDEPATSCHSKRTEAMLRQTYASVTEYAELAQKLPDDVYAAILSTNDPGYLADFIAQQLNLRYQDKQDILDELRPLPRLQRMNEILRREIEVTAMEQDIESKVRSRVGKIQKDFVLREQIKVLQNEIGEGGEDEELDEYREKISKAHLSEEVERKLLKDVDKHIPYEQAKQTVYDALAPLGDDYRTILKNGFDHRWIDVYQNEGKRSGAYSAGTVVHPYVLLNYTGTLDSQFTLAHEMGHALHSYLSNKHQNPIDADYVIFVAEVASTCNEALLMEYLLGKTTDKKERAYLINHFLDQIKGTLYRQTMFAEFELNIGKMAAEGQTLTADVLCAEYKRLNELYYGPDMVVDDNIAMEWARIPHFYYNYYVFQYATGYSAAIALSRRILREGAPAVKDYLGFLSGGCSKSPIDLLKGAGVDMTSPEPVNQALALFGELLDEMEELTRE